MSLNSALNELIGKKITNVITSNNGCEPRYQVFIVFEDNTAIEMYGDHINNSKLRYDFDLEKTLDYAKLAGGSVKVYSGNKD